MKESQNTEFKLSWRDEYIRHLCAFANTQGGNMFVGVADDGSVVGTISINKLLEDIPNKIIHTLGIYVDVKLHDKLENEYLEIEVQPSTVPISFKGVFYVRSGSTTQELKGAELQRFILKKMGRSFDDFPVSGTSIHDIDENVVRKFLRKAINANRLSPDSDSDDLQNIITNLKLNADTGELKNAAILLFGKEPLRFFSAVTFRIGRFGVNDYDLRFQDVIEGNIFEMPDKVIETLRSKYLVSPIRYEGLQRVEELEYPEDALREAILNSIIHKDYTGVHIQMSVYDNKIILWNPGKLPAELAIDALKQKHPSIPRNKIIADIFFKAGFIEAWGRGIRKIIDGFVNAGHPEPQFEELAGGFQVTLFKSSEKSSEKSSGKSSEKILEIINSNPKISASEMAQMLSLTQRAIEKVLAKLKSEQKIKRIGPAKGGHWEVIQK